MIDIHSLAPSVILARGGEELKKWRESQKVRVPGYQFTPGFKRGRWDGYYRPGGKARALAPGFWEIAFSRGMLQRLRDGLEIRNEDSHLTRTALSMEELEWLKPRLEPLRDYQAQAIIRSLQERWGKVALATNAGKGAVIALLAGLSAHLKKPCLILCDEVAVFDALRGEIEKWGEIEPAIIESGVTDIPEDSLVTLAMVPTLARRLKGDLAPLWLEWLLTIETLLLDEADKATAATWDRILEACHSSETRIGFSGTFPDEPHAALQLDQALGPVLVRAKNIELVERGISARPSVVLHPFNAAPALHKVPPEFDTGAQRRQWIYEQAIVLNEDRHRFIASLIEPGNPTCIIVNRVQHGEELEAVIPRSRFLSGSDSKKVRRQVLQDFEAGILSVLIVTKILDRGSNRLGTVADLIFASGEGSNRQSLQRVGRGLRRGGGKEFLTLRDIVDSGHRYLQKAGAQRVALYHSEGFEVDIKMPPPITRLGRHSSRDLGSSADADRTDANFSAVRSSDVSPDYERSSKQRVPKRAGGIVGKWVEHLRRTSKVRRLSIPDPDLHRLAGFLALEGPPGGEEGRRAFTLIEGLLLNSRIPQWQGRLPQLSRALELITPEGFSRILRCCEEFMEQTGRGLGGKAKLLQVVQVMTEIPEAAAKPYVRRLVEKGFVALGGVFHPNTLKRARKELRLLSFDHGQTGDDSYVRKVAGRIEIHE